MKMILVNKRKVHFEPKNNHSTNMKIHPKINIAKVIYLLEVIVVPMMDMLFLIGYFEMFHLQSLKIGRWKALYPSMCYFSIIDQVLFYCV